MNDADPDLKALDDLAHGYGQRLRLVRMALGLSAKALAEECGVSPQRWSHWENERHAPIFHIMLRLKLRRRIPLDWIYAADPDGLPAGLVRDMLALEPKDEITEALQALRTKLHIWQG